MATSPEKAWTFVCAIYKYRTIFLGGWDAPKKSIRIVTKIFLDVDVMGIPEYREVRDEFEILDEVYPTDEMIREVQYHIAII